MSVSLKPSNGLLASLKPKTYKLIQPLLHVFELRYGDVLYEVGAEIKTVYFPEGGIVSLLSAVGGGHTLEVGVVGTEGMVGLGTFLGDKRSTTKALVQGTGTALAMKTSAFVAVCQRNDELPFLLRRFTQSLFTQVTQSAVCNRYHSVEQRLARWLLMCHDRMQSDTFRLTQEFLSNMVGVRREAVNKAARVLSVRKVVAYSRGEMTVLDRAALEKAACECYAVISN